MTPKPWSTTPVTGAQHAAWMAEEYANSLPPYFSGERGSWAEWWTEKDQTRWRIWLPDRDDD